MPRKKKPTPVLGPLSGPRIVAPFIPKPVHFAPPKTFTNATSTEPYTPPRWNVRAAAATTTSSSPASAFRSSVCIPARIPTP